jgi:hypothetical protein
MRDEPAAKGAARAPVVQSYTDQVSGRMKLRQTDKV